MEPKVGQAWLYKRMNRTVRLLTFQGGVFWGQFFDEKGKKWKIKIKPETILSGEYELVESTSNKQA